LSYKAIFAFNLLLIAGAKIDAFFCFANKKCKLLYLRAYSPV